MLNSPYLTDCCICGGGPAGMMLGYLLSKAGIKVIVLEKHKDFNRDFRGDTIHPSTFELMNDLNLLDDFLKIPHQEINSLNAFYNNIPIQIADLSSLKVVKPVVGLMPQWDFLNFLEAKATTFPSFMILKETQVTSLIKTAEKITGVVAKTTSGQIEIRAHVVVGTDGRHSLVRKEAQLHVVETGAPIDVLWFRLSRKEQDSDQVVGRFYKGRIMVQINRGAYWQCAYVIEKGDFEHLKQDGLEKLKDEFNQVIPYLFDRINELKSWEDIKLLNVAIDHLDKWYAKGLICIGDAAHAMSPIGGVGINLAIQDAVATANILYNPLKGNKQISEMILKKIQKRREMPARLIQKIQVRIQKGMAQRRSDMIKQNKLPLPFWLLKHFPFLKRIPAYIIGMGFRPEKPLKVFRG